MHKTMLLTVTLLLCFCHSTLSGVYEPDICDGCRIDNGIGYLPVEGDCFKFIQCSENGDHENMTCGAGTYYNPEKYTCDHCQEDTTVDGIPCNCSLNNATTPPPVCTDKRPVDGYEDRYWQIVTGVGWEIRYCEIGTVFNETLCYCVHGEEGCDGYTQDPSSGIGYKLITCWKYAICANGGQTMAEHECAEGLHFSLTLKTCIWAYDSNCTDPNPRPPPVCLAELYLPFDEDTLDASSNQLYVQDDGVSIHPYGYAMFFENKGLRVPRYTNMDFGTTLEITFYLKLGTINFPYAYQGIVSNADCEKIGSIYIIQTFRSTIDFVVFDSDNRFYLLEISSSSVASVADGYASPSTKVTLHIANGLMTAAVGTEIKTIDFPGRIRRSDCALQLGRATYLFDFTGHIDEFKVFICNRDPFNLLA